MAQQQRDKTAARRYIRRPSFHLYNDFMQSLRLVGEGAAGVCYRLALQRVGVGRHPKGWQASKQSSTLCKSKRKALVEESESPSVRN